jgi:serine/threonine protein kinase
MNRPLFLNMGSRTPNNVSHTEGETGGCQKPDITVFPEPLYNSRTILLFYFNFCCLLDRSPGARGRLGATLTLTNVPKFSSTMNIKKETFVELHYEKLKKLGSGAHASVYVLKDRATYQHFCGKFINYTELEILFSSFHEYKTVTSLNHPHIVKFRKLYIDIPNREIVMVMDYQEDQKSIDHFLKKKKIFTEEELKTIFSRLFDAMRYMHTNGVCHRDLSAENVLLSKYNFRSCTVIDFGLAVRFTKHKKQMGDDMDLKKVLTKNKMSVRVGGNPFYLAPEILKGGTYDHTIDTYSVCMVLLDCCMGMTGPDYSSDVGSTNEEFKEKCSGYTETPKKQLMRSEKELSIANDSFEDDDIDCMIDEFPDKMEDEQSHRISISTKVLVKPELSPKEPYKMPMGTSSSHYKGFNKMRSISTLHASRELKDFLDRGLQDKAELRLKDKETGYHPWLCTDKDKQKKIKTSYTSKNSTEFGMHVDITHAEMCRYLDELAKVLGNYNPKISSDIIAKGRKYQIYIRA